MHDANPSPASSAVGHERVELYLYSPYGPYGLYRASVPVQGYNLCVKNRGNNLDVAKKYCIYRDTKTIQCTCNIILRCVRVTTVVVEKQ